MLAGASLWPDHALAQKQRVQFDVEGAASEQTFEGLSIPKDREATAIIAAVSPKPVNLLINAPFMTVGEAAALGVRRISVGGTLARTAWAGFSWCFASRRCCSSRNEVLPNGLRRPAARRLMHFRGSGRASFGRDATCLR